MISEEDQFLCAGCGQAFAADPPDEFYTKPSKTKPSKTKPSKKKKDSGNVIAVDYDCPSCGVTNAIYWEHPEG